MPTANKEAITRAQVHVYEKHKAVFLGFSIQSQRSEQDTGEPEYEMEWQKREN